MEKNVGTTDRNIRLLAGVLIILGGIAFKSWLGLFGVVLIATGLVNRCALYLPFGINTCKTDTASTE